MRKFSILFACLTILFSITEPAHAQLRIGVGGGINIADVVVDDAEFAEHISSRIGPVIGVRFEYALTDRVAFYFAPCHVMRGYNIDLAEGLDVTLEYIEAPVGAKYYLLTGSVKPYVFGGLALAIKLDAERENETFGSINDDTSDLDVPFHIGLGLELEIDSEISIVLDGRYSRGTININSGKEDGATLHASDIMIMAGLLFVL